MAIISSAFAAQDAKHHAQAEGGAEHMTATGAPEPGGSHEGGFPPFESANWTPQLIWLALIFGLLYLLMSRLALPRVAGILSNRETKIAADLDASREMQVKAQAAATANDATMRARREEAQAIAREAQQKIATETAARRTQVEGDFTAKLKASDERIAAAKTQALGNVGAIATDTAAAILEKLTGASVDHSTLQSEYSSISSH